jgi:phage repressor protein C with HTH and peptisase S24 domain
MQPTYQPGDTLFGWRGPFRPRPGQVVVARRSGQPIIKRVSLARPGGIDLRGDNPTQSTDSRHYGSVPHHDIEAVILAKLP